MKEELKINKVARALGLGLTVSMTVTVLGVAICAAAISGETIALSTGEACITAILLLGSFTGSKLVIDGIGRKRLLTSLLMSVTYFAVLLSVTAVFFGGRYSGTGGTALVVLIGAVTAAIVGGRDKKRGTLRKSKIKHR